MKHFLSLIFSIWSLPIFSQVFIIGKATPSNNWTTDHYITETALGSWLCKLTINLTLNKINFRKSNNWALNWENTTFPSEPGIQDSPKNTIAYAENYDFTFNEITGEYSFVCNCLTGGSSFKNQSQINNYPINYFGLYNYYYSFNQTLS